MEADSTVTTPDETNAAYQAGWRLNTLHDARALLGGAVGIAQQLPENMLRDHIERLLNQADTVLLMVMGDIEEEVTHG